MATYSTRSSALSKEFRLLLLFSRLELDDAQAEMAMSLCEEMKDWEAFRQIATHRFVLPIAYRHLRRLQPASLSAEQMAKMRHQVMSYYQHDLNVMVSLREVIQQLLRPLNIPYVTFKGPSLAARYYDEPAMRFSRDIDILVPRERMPELLALALAEGYRPLDPPELANNPISLAFVARYQKVVTLQSPRGIDVEFHSRIDNIGTVYDSRSLIDKAELMRVGNADVAVLPHDELFVYICWHHTKHFWSHLHWLVDIDAMQRHPSFDREGVLACADRHELKITVEACLKMAEVLSSPDFDFHCHTDARVDELLTLALEAMQGDIKLEHELANRKPTPDFAFHWQTDRRHRLRWQLLGWLRIFRPSYADYSEWPLPPRWHWLYRPLRPWRESVRRWSQSRH
ncbi:MAG: nucleotidyltransferase family protein [Halomonas sp.]